MRQRARQRPLRMRRIILYHRHPPVLPLALLRTRVLQVRVRYDALQQCKTNDRFRRRRTPSTLLLFHKQVYLYKEDACKRVRQDSKPRITRRYYGATIYVSYNTNDTLSDYVHRLKEVSNEHSSSERIYGQDLYPMRSVTSGRTNVRLHNICIKQRLCQDCDVRDCAWRCSVNVHQVLYNVLRLPQRSQRPNPMLHMFRTPCHPHPVPFTSHPPEDLQPRRQRVTIVDAFVVQAPRGRPLGYDGILSEKQDK